MKTKLLIIIGIGIIGLLVATNPQYVDGLCMENQDWPDTPCYGKRCGDSDAPACTDPNWWKEKWSPYYDHKGSEWMEMKKIELLDAIESNNFEEWKRLTPDSSNGNVFNYYFYMGEIPNTDGMFVWQIFDKPNYEIISWDDFEYEFQDDAAIFKNNLAGISILEAGTEYYVIQKAEFKESTFGDKDTRVDATIGYAIQPGDQMLRPPMHEDATDAEHKEFSMKIQKQSKEFPKQSSIGNSYDFVVDIENPFYIKFPFVIEESGQYTRQFYKTTHIFEGPSSSGMGGIVVVDKFSKAVNEDSQCKNDELRRLIKYDYSTVACVDFSSALKLIERGWGI